jgi:hypothetical protein
MVGRLVNDELEKTYSVAAATYFKGLFQYLLEEVMKTIKKTNENDRYPKLCDTTDPRR